MVLEAIPLYPKASPAWKVRVLKCGGQRKSRPVRFPGGRLPSRDHQVTVGSPPCTAALPTRTYRLCSCMARHWGSLRTGARTRRLRHSGAARLAVGSWSLRAPQFGCVDVTMTERSSGRNVFFRFSSICCLTWRFITTSGVRRSGWGERTRAETVSSIGHTRSDGTACGSRTRDLSRRGSAHSAELRRRPLHQREGAVTFRSRGYAMLCAAL